MRRTGLKNLLVEYWQPFAYYGALLLVFGGLLWFRLGTLVDGYSGHELQTLQSSLSLKHIFENPINAPFTLLGRGLLYLGDQGIFWMRIVASFFGLLTITVFYWLVRHWHGERSAFLGTLVFGTSAWFLHTARLGTPDVMMFGLFGLVACSIWLKKSDSPIVLIIAFLLAAGLMYIPGMAWFVVLGVLWQWKTIDHVFKRHLATVTLATVVLIAMLAPLGLAIYKSPELAKVIAGLPAQGWPEPLAVLKRIAEVPVNLLVHGPAKPEHWFARLPILSFFSIVMATLGGYLYLRHWRLARAKLLLAAVVMGTVLIGLGGAVSVSIIIPFVYILVAAGMGFMLDRWYAVFPRNSIAQIVGIGLMSVAVLVTCWYNMRRYLIAWPAVSATKQVFVIDKTSRSSDTIKQ